MAGQDKNQVPNIITAHISDGFGMLGAADVLFDPVSAGIYCTSEAIKGQLLIAIGYVETFGNESNKLTRRRSRAMIDNCGPEPLAELTCH